MCKKKIVDSDELEDRLTIVRSLPYSPEEEEDDDELVIRMIYPCHLKIHGILYMYILLHIKGKVYSLEKIHSFFF